MADSKTIISIGREVGAGGRAIGKIIADRLGYKYVDTLLLSESAKDSGMSEEEFEIRDEVISGEGNYIFSELLNFWNSFTNSVSKCSQESVFVQQSETLRRLAKEENIVVVGRASDYILRNEPGLITCFLHAPIEFRRAQISAREHISEEEAEKIILKIESKRKEFYEFYTTFKQWGHSTGYDICIDVSKFGIEKSAEFLLNYIELRK